jgi:hypothetical protein
MIFDQKLRGGGRIGIAARALSGKRWENQKTGDAAPDRKATHAWLLHRLGFDPGRTKEDHSFKITCH